MHVVRLAAVPVIAALVAFGLASTASAGEICARAGLATAGTATLTAFPTGTGSVTTLTMPGAQLHQPAISPDSATAYVPDAAGDRLVVVAAGPLTQSAAISLPAGAGPTKTVLSPTRSRAYTLNATARTVSIIDTASLVAVGTTTAFSEAIADIALSPDGSTLYVLTSGGGTVTVHPLATTADATTSQTPIAIPTATAGHAIAVTNRIILAVTAGGDGTLFRLPLDGSGTPADAGSLGGIPTALALASDGTTAYVATTQPRLIPVPVATFVPGAPATPTGRVNTLAVGPGGAVYAAETGVIGVYTASGARSGTISGIADSGIAICPSTATVPASPTAANGARGDRSATVAWNPPVTDGGTPISGYTVTASPGGAACTTAGATSCTVEGLVNGTRYTFTVRARNAVGLGPASAASKALTPRRDTSARQLTTTAVTTRTMRNVVTFSVTVTTDQRGILSIAILNRKRVYCANSRRIAVPGVYQVRCRMKGAGRTLVRKRRTVFTVRTVLTPPVGTLARSIQDQAVARRR